MAVFLPGKSLGQRSLAGYSPWGHKRFGHDLVTKQQHNREKLCIIIAGMGFPGGSEVKASARNAGDLGSIPGSERFPWRRKWQPTPVFFPGESHGRRNLVGYSPRGRKESDTTE